MVKLQLDTNKDSLDDLREAVEIVQEAIMRRETEGAVARDAENVVLEETAVETPFFKVTVQSDEEEEPTLNQLLSDPITEDELTTMFKEHGSYPEEEKEEKKKKIVKEESDFIEIVDIDDDQ